jgi:hypothetical protein
MRKILLVSSFLWLAVAATSVQAYSFNNANGWFIDWGFDVTLHDDWDTTDANPNDGGKHLEFQYEDTSAVLQDLPAGKSLGYATTGFNVLYTLEDWLVSDVPPSGRELFDTETLLMTQDADWHYFLVVSSFPDHLGHFSAGDLAINTIGDWEYTAGANKAGLGIKVAGANAGHAETNATWGYGWDRSDLGTTDYRNPLTDTGVNPEGLLPTNSLNDGWGSGFWFGTGADVSGSVAINARLNPANPIFALGDTEPNKSNQTYAFAAKVSKQVLPTVGNMQYSVTCLNDTGKVETPEPATIAMLTLGFGGMLIRRRNRKR